MTDLTPDTCKHEAVTTVTFTTRDELTHLRSVTIVSLTDGFDGPAFGYIEDARPDYVIVGSYVCPTCGDESNGEDDRRISEVSFNESAS